MNDLHGGGGVLVSDALDLVWFEKFEQNEFPQFSPQPNSIQFNPIQPFTETAALLLQR